MTVRAAPTAAEVDRVVFAVHRSISDEDRQRIRIALAKVGLESSSYWVDLADFMIAGSLTDKLVRTRFRYSAREAMASVTELRQRRHVDVETNPTDGLLSVIGVVREVRLGTAAGLWVDADMALLNQGAATMLHGSTGPLIGPYLQLPEPSDPVALLWHRLIGLRYLRADAHAAAWQAAGLTADEIVALTKAWHESDEMSERDRAHRDDIEVETNCLSEPAYQQLDTWADWMNAMAALRSEV